MGGTPERNTSSPTGLATWPWAGGSVLGLLKFGECPGQSARRQRTGTISTPAPLQPQSWIQSTDGIAESWWFFEAFFLLFVALGLHHCMQAFSGRSHQGLRFILALMLSLLIAVASLVAEPGL